MIGSLAASELFTRGVAVAQMPADAGAPQTDEPPVDARGQTTTEPDGASIEDEPTAPPEADQGPQNTADQEARAMAEAATIAFGDGRYADALASFERAYELSLRAEMLYNMGQCTDRLRRDEETIDLFERYLQAVPDAANRRTVQSRLAVLRDRVAREHTRAPLAEDEPSVFERWWFWTLVAVATVGAGLGTYLILSNRGASNGPVPGDVGVGGIVETLRW